MEAIQPFRLPLKARWVLPLSHVALLCLLSIAAVAWGALLIDGREGHEIERFLILVGLYGIASLVFIGTRLRAGGFRVFDIPVMVTAVAFVEFGLAPLACFLLGVRLDAAVDGDYALFERALVYVAVGMFAFWAGCNIVSRFAGPVKPAFDAADSSTQSPPIGRAVICALLLYSVAFLVKTYLLENFGFGYGLSEEAYFENLAAMQVAGVVFQLGTYALVILAIERSFHPFSLERKVLFWVVFVPECFWGLLSGMKGQLLQNFVLVGVAASLAERRIKRGWLAAAVLGLVIIYPFSNQYRELVRNRAQDGMDLMTTGAMTAQAFEHASAADSGLRGWMGGGADSAISRLNLLQSVAELLNLGPRGKLLQGDERWWMLPFYPFVPRFIWHSKPILDKGRRFSIALGFGNQTSTAVTYPGDLLLEFGLLGLLCGMFLFGIAAQYLTRLLAVARDKQRVFIYTALLVSMLTMMELDAFYFWGGLIKTLVILAAVAHLAYSGLRRRRSRLNTADGPEHVSQVQSNAE